MEWFDEPRQAESWPASDAEAAEAGRGWESAPDHRVSPAKAIELGPAADQILIQSWRLQTLRHAKRD